MELNNKKIGAFIQKRRKDLELTQNQLGERLNVSYQAVSKWERGESLPDTTLLLALAQVLETSVDNILNGGHLKINFKRRVSAKDIKVGIEQLANIGSLIGNDNKIYQGLVEGLNNKLVLNIEEYLGDSFKREGLLAELIIDYLQAGVFVDIEGLQEIFLYDHWLKIVEEASKKFSIS